MADVVVFRGLVSVVREDVVEGRFGGFEVVPPAVVVRLVSSAAESGLLMRELVVPKADVLEDGL